MKIKNIITKNYNHKYDDKAVMAEAGYIGGHNRDEPDYSGIDSVPERIKVKKGSRIMAIPPSALKQFKADGWTEVDQDVAEGSQQVDSLVTDALKIMRGTDVSDAIRALKTVLGDREYNSRRIYYNFYVKQLVDMYGQQGMAETLGDLRPKLGSSRDQGKSVRKWRKDRGMDESGVSEAEVDSDGHSVDHADSGEYDYEGDQARDQMNTIVRAARRLNGMLDDNENMPEWVQMKVTLAADYLDTAADYIESNQEPELDEGERGRGRPPSNTQDTTPVTPGRVEKTATGIRHHADASRYGGTEPDAEDDYLMSKSHISRLGKMTEPDIDEGWRETLGAAALTGAMALGAGGAQARVTPDGQGGFTGGLKPTTTQQATDTAPTQSTSSINLAKPQAQYDVDTRTLTYKGKQYKWNLDAQATGQGEVVTAPSMAVGSRSMGSTKVELNPNGTYTRAPVNEVTGRIPDPQNYDSDVDYYNDRDAEKPADGDVDYENMIDEPDDWFDESREKVGNMDADKFDAAMARLKQLAGTGPMKTVYNPNKRVYQNIPSAVQPKK